MYARQAVHKRRRRRCWAEAMTDLSNSGEERDVFPLAARAGSGAAITFGSDFTDSDGRKPDDLSQSAIWRTGLHESWHICTSRLLDLEVAGSTLVEGPSYSGLTWGTGSKRAQRGKAAYDADSAAHDAVVDSIARNMPLPGEPRDCAADAFAAVQAQVISLTGGGAAEMALLGDVSPQFIASDMLSAQAVAGRSCTLLRDRSPGADLERCRDRSSHRRSPSCRSRSRRAAAPPRLETHRAVRRVFR